MAGPMRPDEFGALESLKRGSVKRDNDGGDTAFQSLSTRGMAEKTRRAYGTDAGQLAEWAAAQELSPFDLTPRLLRRYAGVISERIAGRLDVGLPADLLVLDDNLEIERVLIGGEARVVA